MFSLLPLLFLTPRIILIAAAVIPAIILLVYVYRQDKLEKESWSLIGRLVLFGALSTLGAQITESVGIGLISLLFKYVKESGIIRSL